MTTPAETRQVPPIVWTGDLADDCTTGPWHGLVGRAERTGEDLVRGTRDAPGYTFETWWACVYAGDDPNPAWSTNELGGIIGGTAETAGGRVREIVEHAMKAIAFDRGLRA
ncbi:MAG: hypothetical protein JWO31_552 [Phycisphaerales bacterium]|nr:hypothetical protein [Phycisphaerales bacterium]